ELLAEESPERLNADVLLGVLERLHYDVTARGLAAALAGDTNTARRENRPYYTRSLGSI
ncbi:MAG: hypothetical protein IH847_11715, partial [Acidobacteria bacterium]|nr:hypothetical protein [Acidobacteriota bacterium]